MSSPINAPKQPFSLTPSDRHSDTWRRLSRHLEERLATLRAENDGDHDERKTAKLRGRIAEVKAMLGLARDIQIPPPDSE